MHICYVEFGYPRPQGGGGGTDVQLVGRELVRRGHQVSVLAAAHPACPVEGRDERVTVYPPKLRGPLHWHLSKLPGLRVGTLAL